MKCAFLKSKKAQYRMPKKIIKYVVCSAILRQTMLFNALYFCGIDQQFNDCLVQNLKSKTA